MSATETTPPTPSAAAPEAVTHADAGDRATRAFSTSVLISAVRCTLAYIVFPWLLPAIGVAGGIGPGVGLAVGIVAIGFNVASIRRFHRADHPWKWPISALNACVIVLLTILAVIDVSDLLS